MAEIALFIQLLDLITAGVAELEGAEAECPCIHEPLSGRGYVYIGPI
jgi:hypothetical protein